MQLMLFFQKKKIHLKKCIQSTEGFIYRIQCCVFILKSAYNFSGLLS